MQTYLINLDKDKERLAAADVQLKKLGVDYERFPAVYAKELPQAERDASVNYFRWWCCLGRKILLGEIGCALSHYRLYQKMIIDNIPYACILEDDIILKDNFKETVDKVDKWLNSSESQVVLLSNHTNEPEGKEGIGEIQNGLCTESYIITLPAAKALLKENFPIKVPCDYWARWVKHGAIKLYLAMPSVCTQNFDGFVSNMADSANIQSVKNMNFVLRFIHSAKRAIGISLDSLFCAMEK